MSFVLEAVRDRPVFLFGMDDTTPLQDYSGYAASGITSGGTPATHPSLVSGTVFSQVLTSAITATIASPVFLQDREKAPFTLEAWVRVMAASPEVEQQVLGHSGQMDGLTLAGNKVTFRVKFLTAPAAVITYDTQQGQRLHIVGVKTKDKMSLYVNTVLAKELTLTEAQQADKYIATDGNLYSGATAGGQKIAVGPLAGYATTLDKDTINRHYLAATRLPDRDDVITAFGGDMMPLSLANANMFLDQWWTSEEHWRAAELSNVAVVDAQLVPMFNGDTSLPGQWLDSFALGTVETGQTIHGVSMNWDGQGITIEASLDGTTWETAQRGVNLALITPGFNPNNKELQLRVKFPGGIVNDEAFLDNLNVIGVRTAIAPKVAGRTVTYTNGYQERDYPHLQMHDNWGAEIGASGNIVISADVDEAQPIRTVELWIRRSTATVPSFSFTPTTTYQNGAVNASTLIQGQWTLMHVVAPSDITGTLTISGATQIGHVGLYNRVLTATEIGQIYALYTQSTPYRVNNSDTIMVSESAQPVKIYAHDWTIEAAG